MLANAVRQFRKEDFPKFAEFVKKQFHEKYILSDEQFFEWQYRSNPSLDDYAFFLLEKNKEVYGYIGMVPLDYKMGDKTARLNMYANLLVDERVRSLGLGTLLIKRAMEAGSPAAISGYTPKSFPIYQKLGDWRALGNLYRYIYAFNPDAVKKLLPENVPLSQAMLGLLRGHMPPRNDRSLSFEPITTFDASFDEFWRRARGRYANTVERTGAYLNWRYANHPHLKYEMRVAQKDGHMVGYIIYRIERVDDFSLARIVDFVGLEHTESNILQTFISEVANKVDMVDFMASGQYYHESLKQLGFFNVYGTPFEYLPMYFNPVSYSKNYINFCAWQRDESIDKDVFYNHNNWYLTRADGDQDRPNPH
ncbi:MAG: GNAT family N-acetyltransferase [Patescibacteria group bacterium]